MARRYHRASKKIVYIILSIAIAVFGVVVWRVWSKREQPQDGKIRVEISTEEVVSKELEFNATKMIPGEKRECVLLLQAQDTGRYTIDFLLETQTALGTAFSKYVNVSLVLNGKLRGTVSLQEAFNGRKLSISEWISAKEQLEITVVYEMSLGATDEVQNEEIDFDLILNVDGVAKAE